MGCQSSKQAVEDFQAREEAKLAPPTKVMDASSHAQILVEAVSRQIEFQLNAPPGKLRKHLKATQMITREFLGENNGAIHWVKVSTAQDDFPWIFVKMYEPPVISSVSPVKFRGMKKMEQEFKLIMF